MAENAVNKKPTTRYELINYLGLNPDITSYEDFVNAVDAACKDPSLCSNKMAPLYRNVKVNYKHNVSEATIERNIHYTVLLAWKLNGFYLRWIYLLKIQVPNGSFLRDAVPNNQTVIKAMVDYCNSHKISLKRLSS